MNIGGSPAAILARRAMPLGWNRALCELLDNAKDAGATCVVIDFTRPKCLTIRDNGSGCEDLLVMLSEGRRRDSGRAGRPLIGRHGVGAKDAVMWIARKTTIISVRDGFSRTVTVDWEELARQETWDIDDPRVTESSQPNGTTIILEGVEQPAPNSWDDLAAHLGSRYEPALRDGVFRIVIKASRRGEIPVKTPDEPHLDHGEDAILEFSNSRSARIRMGILSRPEQRCLAGVTFAMEAGRVISSRSSFAQGNEAAPGFYAYITLCGRWSFSRNKDGVDRKNDKELEDALSLCSGFQRLLAKARNDAKDRDLEEANLLLSLMHGRLAGRAKAKRSSRTGKHKRARPTGKGSPHRRAAVEQPGDTFDSCHHLAGTTAPSAGKLQIVRESRGDDPEFMTTKGSAVYVNTSHVMYHYLNLNRDLSRLPVLAAMFYAATASLSDVQQRPLPGLESMVADIENPQDRLARAVGVAFQHYVEGAQEQASPVANVS